MEAAPNTLEESVGREARFLAIRADWHRRFPPKPVQPAPAITIKQWRRWSALTLRGAVAVPEGNYKAFSVAMTLGKIAKADGTFDWVRTVGSVAFVEVRPVHRDKVLALLNLTDRRWRQDVESWVGVGMAHRCKELPRGTVRLFVQPETQCPGCGVSPLPETKGAVK